MIPSILMVALGLLIMGSSGEVHATASTLTLTIDSSTVKVDVAPSGHNDTFSKITGSTITASTNNATGYTLSISAPTSAGSDYDKLINTTDNTAKLNSISSPTTEEQYKASENMSYNNTWGYLPSKYCSNDTSSSCATNTSFLPAPTTAGDILDQTTSANSTANTYTIGMGTRIDYNAKPGSYSNSYVIKLVANAMPYTITYNANGGTGAPANVNSSTFDETVALSTTTPTKTNYNFSGWCTVSPTTTAGVDACTGGTTYAAGSNWTLDQTSTTNALTLFAMWSLKSYNITVNFAGSGVNKVTLSNSTYGGGGNVATSGGTVSLKHGVAYNISGTYNNGYEFSSWATAANGALGSTSAASTIYTVTGTSTLTLTGKQSCTPISGYMQNFSPTSSTCTSGTLVDSRDNTTYHVAKLNDGKWWMVENLNIAGGTALSADDTDVTSAYISSFSTSNNLTKTGNTIVLPASSTSGFDTRNYSYVYNSGNKTNCGASGQNTPCYSYYSWDAATLGSGRSISTDNTDAPQSICPKGWRLPTSRTTDASNWQTASDFYALAHQYGLDSTTSTSEPDNGFYTQAGPGTTPNFMLAGYYYASSFNVGGSHGCYWSSTSYSDTSYARRLLFISSYVYSASSISRYSGFSVRCLFSGQ